MPNAVDEQPRPGATLMLAKTLPLSVAQQLQNRWGQVWLSHSATELGKEGQAGSKGHSMFRLKLTNTFPT